MGLHLERLAALALRHGVNAADERLQHPHPPTLRIRYLAQKSGGLSNAVSAGSQGRQTHEHAREHGDELRLLEAAVVAPLLLPYRVRFQEAANHLHHALVTSPGARERLHTA